MTGESIAPDLLRLDDDGPTLLGGYSPSSGHTHFPRQPVCPYTGADDVEPVDLPRTGRLWLWTTVTAPPPGYSGPVPYHFGVVELADGLRVIGRLVYGALEPTERAPVRLTTETVGGDSTATWAFELWGDG